MRHGAPYPPPATDVPPSRRGPLSEAAPTVGPRRRARRGSGGADLAQAERVDLRTALLDVRGVGLRVALADVGVGHLEPGDDPEFGVPAGAVDHAEVGPVVAAGVVDAVADIGVV